MTASAASFDVYLEIGTKRTFAGAIDWPGWCRIGRDAGAALQALADYGPRYARVLRGTGLDFTAPADASAFQVVERLAGDTTTDFGAPDAEPASDARPVDAAELQRFHALLAACWSAFDATVAAAEGKELRKGPRGGGRDLEGVVHHVLGAEGAYLARLGWKHKPPAMGELEEELAWTRQAALDALDAAVRGELPTRGPRGGKIWRPRTFVRRVAWHVLDHVWEIEDRVVSG
jgi:hypothetical protein